MCPPAHHKSQWELSSPHSEASVLFSIPRSLVRAFGGVSLSLHNPQLAEFLSCRLPSEINEKKMLKKQMTKTELLLSRSLQRSGQFRQKFNRNTGESN